MTILHLHKIYIDLKSIFTKVSFYFGNKRFKTYERLFNWDPTQVYRDNQGQKITMYFSVGIKMLNFVIIIKSKERLNVKPIPSRSYRIRGGESGWGHHSRCYRIHVDFLGKSSSGKCTDCGIMTDDRPSSRSTTVGPRNQM